jgi:hypothetical protein
VIGRGGATSPDAEVDKSAGKEISLGRSLDQRGRMI